MKSNGLLFSVVIIPAFVVATVVNAEVLRSDVAFNNGIGEKTESQPDNGVEVSYQIPLNGDGLDGCNVDIVERLYGRDEGAWGIFDIEGDVKCADGSFAYMSSGSWDGNGFHAAGHIKEGSGSGDFENVSGRVAQLGGGASDAGNGTFDISYQLVFETAQN